jgi:hypothetical protein
VRCYSPTTRGAADIMVSTEALHDRRVRCPDEFPQPVMQVGGRDRTSLTALRVQ